MALTDKQLQEAVIQILKIIGVSRLPSQLANIPAAPGKQHFLHIQQGTADGQRINIEQLRGFFGTYNPVSNTPALSNVTGVEGTYYLVSAAGSRDFGNGVVSLALNDVIEYKGGRWRVASAASVIASDTQVLNLGEIGFANVEDAFNTKYDENPVTIQSLQSGFTLITALRNGDPVSWIFVGSSGVYDEVNTSTAEDFFSGGGGGEVTGGADKNYFHDQGTVSQVWTIPHNLNKYPSVTVLDTAKNEVEGNVSHVDPNNLTITFNAAFSGTATLN